MGMAELTSWARMGRHGWRNTGARRPPFAKQPGPGQESVWDYPRPPKIANRRQEIPAKKITKKPDETMRQFIEELSLLCLTKLDPKPNWILFEVDRPKRLPKVPALPGSIPEF